MDTLKQESGSLSGLQILRMGAGAGLSGVGVLGEPQKQNIQHHAHGPFGNGLSRSDIWGS